MDNLQESLNKQEETKKVHVDHNVIVDMEKVSKIFDKTTWAVKKINLQIKKSECVALIGANGAGKSTVGRLIANVIKQTSGIIDYYFKNENIFRAIGYQPKDQQWPNGFKVGDVTKLWISIYNIQDQEWIARLSDIFNIESIKNRDLSKLSSVSLQLFAIFLAMIYKPELLVIDDLSSSIDLERRNKILELFKEYINDGNTIVLVYPDEFFLNNLATRLIYIKNGQVSDDLTIKEVKKEYGNAQGYISRVIYDEDRIKQSAKPDPFFNPIIKTFDSLLEQLQNDYNEFSEGLPEDGFYQFDLDAKNTIFYIGELRKELEEIATSNLLKSSVDKMKKSIKNTKKTIAIMIKEIDKVKKQDNNIKYLSKIERDFFRMYKFISKKLYDVFKNDKLIINGDELEIELEKDEKKQLKALKERYIKEELKIIRLERRRANQNNPEKISKRMLKGLSSSEKEIIEKVAATENAIIEKGIIKVVVLENGKIVLKNENDVKPKDIVLYDKKKTTVKRRSTSIFDDEDENMTLANTIYYDNTIEISNAPKITKEKRNVIDKLLKNRVKKGDQ